MDLSLISTIINIALLATFIISLLFGYLRGFKKSVNNLIANVVIIVFALCFSGLIANLLVNMDISFITGESGSVTLTETIADLILSNVDASSRDVKNTIELVEALAVGVMRLPAFMILLLIEFIAIKPLLKLALKLLPLPAGKTLSFRFIGMGVAFFSYIIIMFFFTAPIFGVLGMANQVGNIIETKEKNESIEIFEELDELNKGIVLGTASALFSEEYTMQAKFTSSLMAVETESGSFRIKNELDNHQLLASIVFQHMEDNDALIQAIMDNYEEILNGFRESEILDIGMPVVIEILRIEMKDDKIDFDDLMNVNWSKEKLNLINLLSAVFEFVESVELNFEKPEEILGSPNLPDALMKVGETLNNSGLFKEVLLVYLNDVVKEAIENSGEDFVSLAEIIDLTKLDLSKDFQKIGFILNDVYKIVLENNGTLKVLENIDMVERLITNIFSLNTIKGNEGQIIEFIFGLINFDSTMDEIGLVINYDNINWDYEIEVFTDVIVDILTIMKNSGSVDIQNAKFNVLQNIMDVERLIKNIFNLSIIKGNEEKLIDYLIETVDLDSALDEIGLKLNYDNVNWDAERELFTNVLIDILKLMKKSGYETIKGINFIELLTNKNNKDDAANIISQLADSALFADSIVLIISNIMDELDLNDWKSEKLIECEKTPELYSKWAKDEILKVLDLYDKLESLTDLTMEDMTTDQLNNLKNNLKDINELEIVSLDNILPLINRLLGDVGINVQVMDKIYDQNNSSQLDGNKDEWDAEIDTLIEIVDIVNGMTFDNNAIKNNYSTVAEVLELMKISAIFGNDLRGDGYYTTDDNIFNEIILDIFTENGLIKDGFNHGFIDYTTAKYDDWTRYDYVFELSCLSHFNTNLATQTPTALAYLQESEIFQEYYY